MRSATTRTTLPPTRLRQWRELNGYTLQEVAGLAGVTVPHLSRVERGERQMAPRTKVLFARRLGVPLTELFDLEPVEEA